MLGLTQATGLTRQAFYYHFADVYDLAEWTFKEIVSNRVMSHASHAQWAIGLRMLLEWMSEHRNQTYQTLAALRPADMETYLHSQFRAVMKAVVADIERDDPSLVVEPGARAFIIDHYTAAVLGHVWHWLATGMTRDPAELAGNIATILGGNVTRSLHDFTPQAA